MYKHLVMWKVKDTAHGLDRGSLIEKITGQLETLPVLIPEIIDYEIGVNQANYGASFFDISIISSFKDEKDFKKYCVYPEHDAVVNFISSSVLAEEIIDYII